MNEQIQTIIAELRDRYAPTATPPCRICGGGLSLERAGGESPSVWRCAGRVEGGYAPGRKIADQHYEDSEWTDYKAGGDQRVIDICNALDAAERRAEEAEAQRDELTTLHRVAEARERRLERDLLAIWATVRPGNPAPLTEGDVLHAVEDVRRERDALRAEVEKESALRAELTSEVQRLRARVDAVGQALAENGCDCECECPAGEHDDDCDLCLACRVEDAVRGATTP